MKNIGKRTRPEGLEILQVWRLAMHGERPSKGWPGSRGHKAMRQYAKRYGYTPPNNRKFV